MEQMFSLILVVLAGLVFLKITGWYSDVAFQQNTEHFLGIPLFSIGATKLTISSILLAIFLSWLVWWLSNWARGVSYRWAYSGIIDMGVRSSLSVFTQYAIVLLGLLIILKGIGIDPTVLSVFVGALGVGIGFGLQNIIHNFVSGLLILLERPVRTGDFISIGSFIGTVQRVGINSLTIETVELEEVRVPNSEIISQIFVNRTSNNDLFRKSLFIGIHYDSNLELAAEIIKKILDQHTGVQKKLAYNIYTWELTEFRINIRVDYFVDTQRSNSLRIHSDILSQIIAQFKEAGIKIPYPQSEVYLNSTSQPEVPGNLITVAT
jgi:potassium efflux system protein